MFSITYFSYLPNIQLLVSPYKNSGLKLQNKLHSMRLSLNKSKSNTIYKRYLSFIHFYGAKLTIINLIQ